MRHPTRLRAAPALLAAAAASLLAGCMQLAPRHERPAAPVPAAFPHAHTNAGTPAADLPWQSYFADPTLNALIALALQNNRDLRIAVLNIDSVRAQLALRRADQLPGVGAGVSASRQSTAGGNAVGAYSAGLVVSAYELDLFGRVRALGDSAAAQLLATTEARKAAQIALVAAVASQALAVAADDDLLELTLRTLATREESLRLTQLRLDNGVTSELELRLSQTLVEGARIALAQQRRQRELDRNALALLIGQPLPDLPGLAGAPGPAGLTLQAQPAASASPRAQPATVAPPRAPVRIDSIALADLPAGTPSDVLLRRPDVMQAEQQLVAANANIGAARAAFWPRITLTGSIGTASSQLLDLFKDGAWSFAAQLLQPIFDAGRNQANLALAQVQRDIAVAQYERAVQAAFRDVADALAGRATLGEQLQATRALAAAEEARYVLAELRFRNGISNSLELLDAQRALFAAQQAVVQTQLALLQNRVAGYRALGGGGLVGSSP